MASGGDVADRGAALTGKLASASGSPAQWRAVADGWARRRAFVWEVSHHVGERLVQALDPKPGETVLELACGPGDTGFLAVGRLGPGGRLISTDVAPEMVATARKRAAELGLRNVEHMVVDAQEIPLEDGAVDGVLCRWGYMLVPDPARALAETRRVLRPGGRLAFAVWAEADANPWGTAVGRALLRLGYLHPPDPDAPGPFRLGSVERVRALLDGAGFGEATVEDVHLHWRYESFDAFWTVTRDLSFLMTTALETLSADEVAEMCAAVEAELAPYEGPDGSLSLPGLCRNVVADVPG